MAYPKAKTVISEVKINELKLILITFLVQTAFGENMF